MTEDKAKTKSCCGPMQAEFGKTHVVNCIGSACMAWRWYESPYPGGGTARSLSQSDGYCGLAGPQ